MLEPPPTLAFRARLLLVLAAVLWSLSGVLVKHPGLSSIPLNDRAPILACGRALFAAMAMLPFLRRESMRWRTAFVPMIIAFFLMNVLFLAAMTRTSAAAAIFLQYTAIVWTFLLGRFLLGEPIRRGNLVAMLLALFGILWIVAGDWTTDRFTGNLLALGSGFSYGCVVISLRFLRDEDASWLTFLNHGLSGVLLLPWVLTVKLDLNVEQVTITAILGVFQMGVPYLLFARGVKSISAQEASLIVLLEPFLTPALVLLFWGEAVSAATWIGGAFIIGGLVVRYTLFPLPRESRNDDGITDRRPSD